MALSELEKYYAKKVASSKDTKFVLIESRNGQLSTYGPLDHDQADARIRATANPSDYTLVALGQAYSIANRGGLLLVKPIEFNGMRVLPKDVTK